MAPMVGCETQPVRVTGASFDHGVASGDPLSDRVILWTRVSGVTGDVDVRWRIARDRDMRRVVADGEFRTGPERDFTVKVDAEGLPAGGLFHYQFTVGDSQSPIGRTRTLPVGAIDSAATRSFEPTCCASPIMCFASTIADAPRTRHRSTSA